MRRVTAALAAVLLLSGCSSGRPRPAAPPTSQSATSSSATPSAAAPPPAPPATATLDLTGTSTLVVHAAPAPPSLMPTGVQDLVFADAADGWLVTSQQVAPDAWNSGIWRTADGGVTWREVWQQADGELSRIGLLPSGDGIYAVGYRGSPGTPNGSPLWLTSTDRGSTWTAATPSLPAPPPAGSGSLYIPAWPSLRFDFVTPNVGYGAVDPEDLYQQRTPVWATTDAGRTWRALPLPADFFPTGGLDFLTVRDGWITGSAQGSCNQLWHTTDGGQSWLPIAGTCGAIGLYAVDFLDGQHGFAAGGALPVVGARTGILETSDGGAHWQRVYADQGQAAGPVTHLTFSSATQGWAWGATCKMGQNGPCRGAILVTHDGGRTWIATGNAAVNLSAVGNAAWVDQGWPQEDGMAETTDGGRTWQVHVQPQATDFWRVSTAPGSTTIWLSTPGGTFASADYGATWVAVSTSGYPLSRAGGGVVFDPATPILRASRDNGGTWTTLRLPGSDLGVADVSFGTESDGWALLPTKGCTWGCAAVDRTEDGGLTWTAAGGMDLQGTNGRLAFSSEVGVAVGMTGDPPPNGNAASTAPVAGIAVSRDQGAHWTVSPLPSGYTCFDPAAQGPALWVPCQTGPTGGALLRSADGGRTWTAAAASDLVPEDVAMTDQSHGWMLAAAGGPTSLALYRTADGGTTWTQVWPDLPGQ